MNLLPMQQTTSGYNTIPSIPDATVPLGTTILSPSMTTVDRRSSKGRNIAIVVGTMLMLMAGGTVWMRQAGETAVEGLVVATEWSNACFPVSGTFGGVPKTDDEYGLHQDDVFISDTSNRQDTPFNTGSI